MEFLGQFINETGVMVISDPSYDLGTWCQGVARLVKPGKYNAYIIRRDCEKWGIRNAEVLALHESIEPSNEVNWQEMPFQIGVDSGQAGLFDLGVYKDDNKVEKKESTFSPDSPWYSSCCDLTLKEPRAGVLPGGVVSSAGFGDGGYLAYSAENDLGKIVALKIIFLTDEDFE